MASESIKPTSVNYFYGRITRDAAEAALANGSLQEGLYLLRESMTTAGNYALSICHQGRVHHYSIESQPDGCVMIQDGKKFKGPIELVNHHKKSLDGFLTRPSKPCERSTGMAPMAWPGFSMVDLDKALLEKAQSMGLKGNQLVNICGPQRNYFVNLVAKDLHREMPWFHGRIGREQADSIMAQSKHDDGKFLVRERDDKSYALSLSHKNLTKHYKIEKHKAGTTEKLAIEDGPRFDSLMDMVAHYHNKTDGLLCKLSMPCIKVGYKKRVLSHTSDKNPAYGHFPDQNGRGSRGSQELNGIDVFSQGASAAAAASAGRPLPTPPNKGSAALRFNDPAVISSGVLTSTNMTQSWDEPGESDMSRGNRSASSSLTGLNHVNDTSSQNSFGVPADSASQSTEREDAQEIYDSVPRSEDVFNLNANDIELHEKLGSGNFGSVLRGTFRRNGQCIPVAVKTLKHDELPTAESELMKEAKVMAELKHRNIVRMFGVSGQEPIMLVLELATLGPLNRFLKKNQDLQMKMVLDLMFQVAEAMAYLESKNFVHRDLAARNVLLVNPRFAKISDFGMSKALGLGNEYYKAHSAGKWPLKWYAPECIYFFKFDSKSDVWSYGVTLWEGTSYGAKPYRGMRGQEILDLIEQGRRLDKPDNCPPGIYENIMVPCWMYNKEDRPSFQDIVDALRKYR